MERARVDPRGRPRAGWDRRIACSCSLPRCHKSSCAQIPATKVGKTAILLPCPLPSLRVTAFGEAPHLMARALPHMAPGFLYRIDAGSIGPSAAKAANCLRLRGLPVVARPNCHARTTGRRLSFKLNLRLLVHGSFLPNFAKRGDVFH
jgi:hypothetical protein